MTSPNRRVIRSGAQSTLFAITQGDACDVEDWLATLDTAAQVAFNSRFEHLTDVGRLRSPDAWRHLGDGVFEIKVHTGPGYRLYILRDGNDWIATHGIPKPKDRKVSAEIKKAQEAFKSYRDATGGRSQ